MGFSRRQDWDVCGRFLPINLHAVRNSSSRSAQLLGKVDSTGDFNPISDVVLPVYLKSGMNAPVGVVKNVQDNDFNLTSDGALPINLKSGMNAQVGVVKNVQANDISVFLKNSSPAVYVNVPLKAPDFLSKEMIQKWALVYRMSIWNSFLPAVEVKHVVLLILKDAH